MPFSFIRRTPRVSADIFYGTPFCQEVPKSSSLLVHKYLFIGTYGPKHLHLLISGKIPPPLSLQSKNYT